MSDIRLLLAFHSHQPVGNFHEVFQKAVDRSYKPFLHVLAQFPVVQCALHYSGPLLQWLDQHRPDVLDLVASLVNRGQVELMGGAFQEPMISVLPSRDAQDQVQAMDRWLKRRFGVSGQGMWLPERVWEPQLPSVLAPCQVDWTLIDDTHLRFAGLGSGCSRPLSGYYVTEKSGHTLSLFPIAKSLRYLIPFAPVEEVIAHLRSLVDGGDRPDDGPVTLTFGDDGEKFGLWPGTHKLVYQDGWLSRFFQAITRESPWLETCPPGRHFREFPPTGRVYVPSTSYEEMNCWALPTESGLALERLKERLDEHGLLQEASSFLQGGTWQGFLSKYDEANRMHKKMIRVSDKVHRCGQEAAREALHRGQCNCAYWHGLFGGIYLGHLRHGVYANLIEAETLADPDPTLGRCGCRTEVTDVDGDLQREVLMENAHLNLWVKPHGGGSVVLLEHRPTRFHLTNVLTRRPEVYHALVKEALVVNHHPSGSGGDSPEVQSIHHRQPTKPAGLDDELVYDACPRNSFLDRVIFIQEGRHPFLPGHPHQGNPDRIGDPTQPFLGDPAADQATENLLRHQLDRFRNGTLNNAGGMTTWGQPATSLAALTVTEILPEGVLLEGTLSSPAIPVWPRPNQTVALRKRFRLDQDKLTVDYQLRLEEQDPANATPHRWWFVCELNLTLLAERAHDRRVILLAADDHPDPPSNDSSMAATHISALGGVRGVALIDESLGLRADILWNREGIMARYPFYTANRSESGFERTYQGSCFLVAFPVNLETGGWETLQLRLECSTPYCHSKTQEAKHA